MSLWSKQAEIFEFPHRGLSAQEKTQLARQMPKTQKICAEIREFGCDSITTLDRENGLLVLWVYHAADFINIKVNFPFDFKTTKYEDWLTYCTCLDQICATYLNNMLSMLISSDVPGGEEGCL